MKKFKYITLLGILCALFSSFAVADDRSEIQYQAQILHTDASKLFFNLRDLRGYSHFTQDTKAFIQELIDFRANLENTVSRRDMVRQFRVLTRKYHHVYEMFVRDHGVHHIGSVRSDFFKFKRSFRSLRNKVYYHSKDYDEHHPAYND